MPLVDLFVMVKISTDKKRTDLPVEGVRGVIALFGVNDVRRVQSVVAKKLLQPGEKSGSKMLTTEPGVDRDHQQFGLRLIMVCSVRSFGGMAAVSQPVQKGRREKADVSGGEKAQLKREGRVIDALPVECADNDPGQRLCFIEGGEAGSSRALRDVPVIAGAEGGTKR